RRSLVLRRPGQPNERFARDSLSRCPLRVARNFFPRNTIAFPAVAPLDKPSPVFCDRRAVVRLEAERVSGFSAPPCFEFAALDFGPLAVRVVVPDRIPRFTGLHFRSPKNSATG